MARRKKGLSFHQKKKKLSTSLIKEIWSYIFIISASVLIAFVLVYSVGMRTSMLGVSMEPALFNGQDVLVNRFSYKLMSPRVGDTIVFLPNGNQNQHYSIKRIAAKPGDIVVIRSGILYVNNNPYRDVVLDKIADAGILENELTLESDEFFVIGVNINNSEDSRSTNIGPVKKSTIIGKVWFHMASDKLGMGLMD